MPIYEYVCQECEQHHEVMQKISEEPLTACPSCGGMLRKMISSTSFVLKGTGWYATDYASGAQGRKDKGTETPKTDSTTGSAETKQKETEKKTATPETVAAK